jgi:hypothetical protein
MNGEATIEGADKQPTHHYRHHPNLAILVPSRKNMSGREQRI